MLMRLAEWAVKRTDWWEREMAALEAAQRDHKLALVELEAARLDLEIRTMIAETRVKQAATEAKISLVDDLRAALEAHNA